MTKDRAEAVAPAIIALLGQWLRDPALRAELVALLRDEFADLRREILSEIPNPPSE